MAITLSAFCLAILTVSVLGGLLPLATVLNHTRLQVYLSFSAGTMLGAAFFHMMPEAVRVGSAATIHWAAFGLLALFFLERFFSFHHHEPHAHVPCRIAAKTGVEHTHHESSADCTAAGSSRSLRPGDIGRRCGPCRGVRPPLGWSFIRSSVVSRWRAPSLLISRCEPAWEAPAWACSLRPSSTSQPMP